MNIHCIRIRNRILQKMYRPRQKRSRLLSAHTMASLDAIDKSIEEKITPLLSGLF
jgi:hypothetical protein